MGLLGMYYIERLCLPNFRMGGKQLFYVFQFFDQLWAVRQKCMTIFRSVCFSHKLWIKYIENNPKIYMWTYFYGSN